MGFRAIESDAPIGGRCWDEAHPLLPRFTLRRAGSSGVRFNSRDPIGVLNTVAHPDALDSLKRRLAALEPETPRRWGTLSAHEMLCHLGDAFEMALRIRPRKRPVPVRMRRVLKGLGLWTPIRWPHGWPTNPHHNPRADGTRPSEFDADRARLIAALEHLASPDAPSLEPAHGLFGRMSAADWQRWAYKHTDHHLRQFGL